MGFKRLLLIRPVSRCGWGFLWAPLAINLEYIAATVLRDCKGVEVKIVNEEFDSRPIQHHLKEFTPDLVGITMSATERWSGLKDLKVIRRKVSGVRTIVGGFHPTAVPEQLLAHDTVDMVGYGEAELTMVELMKNADPEGIKGIVYKDAKGRSITNEPRPVVKDLDSLPFPARDLREGDECVSSLKAYNLHRDQIHTSRGCQGKCTFCCEPMMSHSRQRFRKPEKVMDEIREIFRFHHEEPAFVLLGDPHFMGGPVNVERLCDLLIEADLPIQFTAMVRADKIAKYPKIVEKMVKAGIIGYCMGMESPNEQDLAMTKKGIDNRAQVEAVQSLRRNNAIAGGTFVCGLPGQTVEEILMIPEYARHVGMINAAFPIATPHAATEFYIGLDNEGKITEPDWSKYDQMHLCFKHEAFTPEESVEILTRNMGRFYALDIFLDDIIAVQNRDHGGRKKTIWGALAHFVERMNFVRDAGGSYDTPKDGAYMGTVFLKAQVQPHTRKRTTMMGMHNIIDLDTLLGSVGDQTLCFSIRHEGRAVVHYVLRMAADKVHYMDITNEQPDNVTIGVQLDMEDVTGNRLSKAQIGAKLLKSLLKTSRFSSLARGIIGLLKDRLRTNGEHTSDRKMVLPKGWYEHFCKSDDWDPAKYQEIQDRKNNGGK